MQKALGRFAPHTYAILRIITGLMFALHGSQKLFGWPGDKPPAGVLLYQIAGVIELVCGLLIALGLLTSYAAVLAAGQMAVAYFKSHAPNGFFPVINQGELAVVYCFLFLYFAARGSGIWSVDGGRGGARGIEN
jgi:putative oxidoreductase